MCLGGPLGGDMDAAFQYEEQAAVCTEQSYPYTAKDGQCHASACTVGIPDHGVTGFVDVKADDEEALMDAVAQQPVSVAIEADKRAFQNYQSGVLSKSLVLNGAPKICGTGRTLDFMTNSWTYKKPDRDCFSVFPFLRSKSTISALCEALCIRWSCDFLHRDVENIEFSTQLEIVKHQSFEYRAIGLSTCLFQLGILLECVSMEIPNNLGVHGCC